MSTAKSFLGLTAAAVVGYCIYFDYSRRHNAEFRKNIKRKVRKAEKAKKAALEQDKTKTIQLLKQKLVISLAGEPLPSSPEEKERYFMTSVTKAEGLAQIPGNEIDAAILFYKALSVYPQPTAILEIYQKTIPPAIYDLVISLTAIQPPQVVANMLDEEIPETD